VTERKRAEEALRESTESFRLLSEVSFEGIAIHENGRITDANDAFAALGGYERAEVIGMRTLDFTAPESHDEVREHIQAEAEEPLEIIALTKDGKKFHAEVRAKTLPLENRIVRVVAVRDISQRKAQEAALHREREELEGNVERQMVHKNRYRLSFREYTVLHFVATGKADKEIAWELGISPLTVQKHVASILAKMRAASRTEAGVRAVREGMLD
jgi:PAS domain S-box-containing protein